MTSKMNVHVNSCNVIIIFVLMRFPRGTFFNLFSLRALDPQRSAPARFSGAKNIIKKKSCSQEEKKVLFSSYIEAKKFTSIVESRTSMARREEKNYPITSSSLKLFLIFFHCSTSNVRDYFLRCHVGRIS